MHEEHFSKMKCHFKDFFEESNQTFNEIRYDIEESIFNHDLMPGKIINETSDSLIIKILVPGVKKEDINIDLTETKLYLEAELKIEHFLKGGVISLSDKKTVSIHRKISLPKKVVPTESKAKIKNGILKIKVAKLEKENRVNVKIK